MTPTTDVQLRPFRRGDAEAVAAVWTRAAPRDPITPDRLLHLVLLDRNFDPGGFVVAEHDGRLVGAAYGVRRLIAEQGADLEPALAWMPFLFVDPDVQGHGIGRALVERTMQWARHAGATTLRFSDYTPGYVLPGLDRDRYPAADRLLASLGFRPRTEVVAMDLRMADHLLPPDLPERRTRLAEAGVTFRTPGADDLPGLVRLAGTFSPDWGRAVREALLGGLPREQVVIAADDTGDPVGWAMCGTYEGVLDRFGPFGVSPSHRGSGIGLVLLHVMLERMRALGAHGAWFLWTGPSTAAGRLYLRAGFDVTRTFTLLEADLTR